MLNWRNLILGLTPLLIYASPAEAAKLEKWNFDADQNRLEITTDEAIKPTAVLIYNPYRLIVDLPNTQFGKPIVRRNFNQGVKQVRVAQFTSTTTRMVIEVKPGFVIDPTKISVLPGNGNVWNVDLNCVVPLPKAGVSTVALKVDSNGQVVTAPKPPVTPPKPPVTTPKPPVTVPQPPVTPKPPTSSVPNSDIVLPTVPAGRYTVVIDPGHGGFDPGAVGIAGVREKDVVIDVSTRVAQHLRDSGARVVMTRTTDIELDLQPRVDIAERARGTVFVSIHANAISLSRPDVNGVETFYYGSANGKRLADTIHRSFLNAINIDDRRVREARFYVIRQTSMPAALLEMGFLTGAKDTLLLRNPETRKRMARATAQGILRYLRNER